MSIILVTGANGFIGSAVCATLAHNRKVRAAVRRGSTKASPAATEVVECDFATTQDWSNALKNVSAIVHCAARVHVMKEKSLDPLAEFRAVNVTGTLKMAKAAAAAGVERFIFLSSIGVNGLETGDTPFRSCDSASPRSDYALSKLEAEQDLMALASRSTMDVVIIRPPLVYGPGAPGNFRTLISWVSRGIPLPLGAVTRNRRSFINLQNLADLIELCLDHPAAANEIFLASDGEDLSTADFLIRIGRALDRQARLFPVPSAMLYAVLSLLGKKQIGLSLCRSLEVDIRKTRDLLGWSPATKVDEGLRKAVVDWRRPGTETSG